MQFSQQVLRFISHLHFPVTLPDGIEVMHPFGDAATMQACTTFYNKYYADHDQRWMIIGINPGRLGGGITGIPFTDPVRLKQACGIDNPWQQKRELSSLFIYEMIEDFGGPEAFYRHFYFTAVSPLGFTRNNKNLNYYDDKNLQENIRPFIVDCLEKQFQFGIQRSKAFCLGDGKNFKFLNSLNKEMHLFDSIIPLSHPRFIMQYRLKEKQIHIDKYIRAFNSIFN